VSKNAAPPSSRPKRRGANVYLAGAVVGQACALLRYTLLARLLGPQQLGLVATLILVSNFFELISDTGSDRFLVQDPEGDEPAVQKMVQLVFLSRGAFMAAGLAIFAWPISRFYHEPALFAGLAILGLSPLLAGAMHLDNRRFQRHHDFRAEGIGMVASELLGLAATVIAAYLTRDYTAVLYGLITRSLVQAVVSHLRAERAYRLAYDPTIARRLRKFSGPLIANGVLMFMSGQSDRLMISSLVGLVALGHYSAVLLLVLYPTAALGRYFNGIHLPLVSPVSPNPTRGSPPDLVGGRSLLLSLGILAGFAVVGPVAVRILYGAKFTEAPFIVALVGVLQTARFIRNWPTVLALGMGQSRIVMANNFARMVGIPAGLAGLALIGGVAGVVSGIILGEFVALATAIVLLNKARDVRWTHDFDRIIAFAVGCVLVLGLAASVQARWMPGVALILPSLLLTAWLVGRERASIDWGIGMGARILRLKA
jgi:O-antigen/teichoic acid export membrane protein